MKYLAAFSFALLIFLMCRAQTPKTSFPVQWQTKTDIEKGIEPHLQDTGIQQNETFIPFYAMFGAFQDLGNLGTAVNPVFWKNLQPFGFNLGSNPYQFMFKTPEQTKYYQTRMPLADFSYHQGPNDFILFHSLATANVLPNLNVGVDFTRNTGKGFYPNQAVSQYYTQVFGKYESPDKRWLLLANYNWNRGKNNENGGLVNDSVFESLTGNNKAAPVILQSCESRFRQSAGNINAYYFFGKKVSHQNADDSLTLFEPNAFISYSLTQTKQAFYFDNVRGDTSQKLFPAYIFENNADFKDSVNNTIISQQVAFNKKLANHKWQLTAGLKNDIISITQRQFTEKFINNQIFAEFEKIKSDKPNELSLKLNGAYCFRGYNQNDVLLGLEAAYGLNKFLIQGGVINHLFQPDYLLHHFRSNPFVWQNNFNKTNLTHWFGSIKTTKLKYNYQLRFNQYIYQQFVFVNTLAKPEQTDKTIVINTVDAEKTFAWKFLRFNNQVMLQQTNSNNIRIPDAIVNIRYYADVKVLKVLQLQTGFNVFYNTAYFGNAYNPVSRLFYLQNEKEIGNYPLADVFITAMVKKAIFYFKMGHINANLINEGFYYTPGYPLPLRALYLGLRWRMYN